MFLRRAGSLLFAVSLSSSLAASELDITPAVLTDGEYGVPFHRVITVSGGTPPYLSLTVTNYEALGTGVAAPAIDLAAGTVTFDSTPTHEGGVSFTVAVTDSNGASTERDYAVLINEELFFNAVVGEGVVGHGLGVYIPVAAGTPPYTSLELLDWDASGTGAEAPVIDLATWSISGTSTVTGDGVATFRVRATDSAGGVAEQQFSVFVDSTLHMFPRTLPPGSAGTLYDHILHIASATNIECCADISVTSFDDGGTGLAPPIADPTALTFLFSSTPAAAGTVTVTVHVEDTIGETFDTTYSITIHPAMTIAPPTLPEGTAGEIYDHVVTISGGVPPYKLIRLHGYLPPTIGIPTPTLNRATGTVTFDGTPAAASLVNFDLTVYDSANGTAYQELTLVVARPLSLVPETPPGGKTGHPYNELFFIDGGSPPFTTFEVNSFDDGGTGLAPPALDTLSGTIIFDSTPPSPGTASFSIEVVDSYGRTLLKNVSIVIQPLSAPTGTQATMEAPGVLITWNASDGASSYEVERSADGVTYSVIAGTTWLGISDGTAEANAAYFYRVRVVSPALSPYSAPDLATAIVFTNPSFALTPIRSLHFSELRTAVNSVRTLAGLAAFTFADSPIIEAIHLTQLRSALEPARAALGLPPLTYTQPTITPNGTTVLAADLEELRNGVK